MLFKDLDGKEQRELRIAEYNDSFADKVCNLYDIVIPDLVNRDSAALLAIAYKEGRAGLVKYKDGYAIGSAAYIGSNPDVDGILNKVKITFKNGESVEVDRKDAAVLHLNNIQKPMTYMISRYSNMLSDIDCAMMYNINFSKLCPIPIVETDVEKKAMSQIIENLFNGVVNIFKRANLRTVSTGDGKVPTLDLTNPQASTYISNYSSVHDDIILRVCAEMGINLNTKDKKAQVNNGELSGFSDYACLSGKSLKRQLDIFVKQCKDNLGIDVTATPSEFVYTEDDIRQEFEAEFSTDNEVPVTPAEEDQSDDDLQID